MEDYFGPGVHSGGCHFYLTGTSTIPVIGFWDEPHRSTYYPTETTGIQMFGHFGQPHPDSPDKNILPRASRRRVGLTGPISTFECMIRAWFTSGVGTTSDSRWLRGTRPSGKARPSVWSC